MTVQSLNPASLIGPHTDALTRAGQNKAGLTKAAQEFESLFVGYLLKIMRETLEETGGEDSGFGRQIYTELFDQEVARSIARQGVLGIADMIEGRLSAAQPASQPATGTTAPTDDASGVPDFRLPVQSPISSGYGLRSDPFTHKPRMHRGVDIAAPEGTEVEAVLGGEVVAAGFEQGYGNTVVVRHSDGLQTRYAHLGKIAVRNGDAIGTHQVLGSVGSTGRSTGPHLHFEVIRDGRPVDPFL
jgi:murein DD-endopeptidase MepM/ murein hydrolase activator NlpD